MTAQRRGVGLTPMETRLDVIVRTAEGGYALTNTFRFVLGTPRG